MPSAELQTCREVNFLPQSENKWDLESKGRCRLRLSPIGIPANSKRTIDDTRGKSRPEKHE